MADVDEQLKTIIDGSGEPIDPDSRVEVILDTAIDGRTDYPEPKNRFEDLLERALQVQGGGGGISDVKIDGESIVSGNVGIIPRASESKSGVIKTNIAHGVTTDETGHLIPITYSSSDYDTLNDSTFISKGTLNPIVEKVNDLELFKFPNVTIIGEPTVNHGQISGFNSDSYLKFPFLVDFRGQNFEINMAFTTGANVTNQENIFDSDFGLAFAIRNGRFVIAASSNGTSWNIGEGVGTLTVQPRTTYYIRLSWNKLQYKLEYSLDNKTFATDITVVNTAAPYPKQVYIGVGENFASILNSFSGTINLNYATLKIGTEVVWAGMDDAGLSTRADVSLSNIDADGEAKIRSLIPIVILTQEEYDALPEKSPTTLYFIKE